MDVATIMRMFFYLTLNKELVVIRVRPTPNGLPTNTLHTPVDGTIGQSRDDKTSYLSGGPGFDSQLGLFSIPSTTKLKLVNVS